MNTHANMKEERNYSKSMMNQIDLTSMDIQEFVISGQGSLRGRECRGNRETKNSKERDREETECEQASMVGESQAQGRRPPLSHSLYCSRTNRTLPIQSITTPELKPLLKRSRRELEPCFGAIFVS